MNRALRTLGINPRQYWLLVDLFFQLSDRREILDRASPVTIKSAALIYGVFTAFIALFAGATLPVRPYFITFQFITAFMLFAVLLPQAGAVLVNPQESRVLAHQPINGATITAAKLSHLLRMVLTFTVALDAFPALVGIFVKGGSVFYPLIHLSAALAVGLVAAFLCCGIYGWLIRLAPPGRLRTISNLVEMTPLLLIYLGPQIGRMTAKSAPVRAWEQLPEPARNWSLTAAGLIAAALVIMGVRSLSGDYLLRANAILAGRSGKKAKVRRSWLAQFVGRLRGGPAAVAGYQYLNHMVFREPAVLRAFLAFGVMSAVGIGAILMHINQSPFSESMAPAHFFPHSVGAVFCILAFALPFGTDFKARWIFGTVSPAVFNPFTRGLHSLAWVWFVAIPHTLLLPVVMWFWDPWHGVLFTAFSAAVASLYVAVGLRLIGQLPFTRQPEQVQGAMALPVFFGVGLVIVLFVVIQRFVVFRSVAAVVIATTVLAAAAWFSTQFAIAAFLRKIVFQLSVDTNESSRLYTEIAEG